MYTFDTILLSAQKTGNPNLLNTQLSAQGVNVITLAGDVVGVAFNKQSTLSNNLCSVTVGGCLLKIDNVYDKQTFTLVKTLDSNLAYYSVFPYLSTASTVASNALSSTTQISTPNTRRKRLLGYV